MHGFYGRCDLKACGRPWHRRYCIRLDQVIPNECVPDRRNRTDTADRRHDVSKHCIFYYGSRWLCRILLRRTERAGIDTHYVLYDERCKRG